MTSPIIHAGMEPLLFYLAIVVVWSVLKKISGKEKQPGEHEAGDGNAPPPKDMEEGLREFIETVTGQKLPEPKPPDAPPPPVFQRKKKVEPPQLARQRETRPPIQQPRVTPKKPVQASRATPTPALAPRHYDDLHTPGTVNVETSEIADFIHDDLQASLGKMSSLTRMPSMRMAMPSLKLATATDESRPRFRVKLGNRNDLRRAIVHRVVLGPPRAMGSDYDENQLSL